MEDKKLGICNSFTTKIWGLFEGLKLAKSMGFKQIIVELDSKCLVDQMNRIDSDSTLDRVLLQICLKLLKEKWNVQITHCFKKANRCVNWLTSYSLTQELGT